MLTRINTWELDPVTIMHYHKAILTDDHAGTAEDVSISIGNESKQLWVWGTVTSTMVIVTEIRTHSDAFMELVVLMLAGDGGFNDYDEVVQAFADRCAELHCERVIAYIKPELWKIFKEHGAHADELYTLIGKDAT